MLLKTFVQLKEVVEFQLKETTNSTNRKYYAKCTTAHGEEIPVLGASNENGGLDPKKPIFIYEGTTEEPVKLADGSIALDEESKPIMRTVTVWTLSNKEGGKTVMNLLDGLL